MEKYDFLKIFEDIKYKHPIWFEVGFEPVADNRQIMEVEFLLQVKLPEKYSWFLLNIGSGYIGSMNIFSVDKNSIWYLIKRVERFNGLKYFIPVTDDESGGYYGFFVKDGVCSDAIYYVYPDEGGGLTFIADDFFEYVYKCILCCE